MRHEERVVRGAHERAAAGETVRAGAGVRELVVDSWSRATAAGLRAESAQAPLVLAPDDLAAYRDDHVLSRVFPLLYDVLGRAAEDCGSVMAVGDAAGRLLWVCGRPRMLDAAESIRFVEGTSWDEATVGTNAPGTSLRLDRPVIVDAGEHFAVDYQPWSCAAAPIHDPATGSVLGVVDLTGAHDVASPQSLAMVRSAARMAEAELGRLALVRQLSLRGSRHPEQPTLRIEALGRPDCHLDDGTRELRLSVRHSELLVVLASRPEGLSGEELAMEVYGDRVPSSTVRAELTRLRAMLGDHVLASRPYRLCAPHRCDWVEVEEALDRGDVTAALRGYRGPLLPQSDSPALAQLRSRLEYRLRSQVLASFDVDLVLAWTRSRWGVDDLEAWERQVALLPPSSPLHRMSLREVARLQVEFGLVQP